jgi:hypothetical protein
LTSFDDERFGIALVLIEESANGLGEIALGGGDRF